MCAGACAARPLPPALARPSVPEQRQAGGPTVATSHFYQARARALPCSHLWRNCAKGNSSHRADEHAWHLVCCEVCAGSVSTWHSTPGIPRYLQLGQPWKGSTKQDSLSVALSRNFGVDTLSYIRWVCSVQPSIPLRCRSQFIPCQLPMQVGLSCRPLWPSHLRFQRAPAQHAGSPHSPFCHVARRYAC